MINNYDDRPIAPLFSIITVTYNAADTLPRTLASVKVQSCHLYEHLIIDGGSSDATLQLAKNAGIQQMKIHSGKDNGIYDAMNKGLGDGARRIRHIPQCRRCISFVRHTARGC